MKGEIYTGPAEDKVYSDCLVTPGPWNFWAVCTSLSEPCLDTGEVDSVGLVSVRPPEGSVIGLVI